MNFYLALEWNTTSAGLEPWVKGGGSPSSGKYGHLSYIYYSVKVGWGYSGVIVGYSGKYGHLSYIYYSVTVGL